MIYKKILVSITLAISPVFSLAYTWDSCLSLTKVMNNTNDKELLSITGPLIFKSVDAGCKNEGGTVILYRIFTLHGDFESSKSFVINNYPKLMDGDFVKMFKLEYCARDPKSGKWVFRGDPIYYAVNRVNGDLFARYQFGGASCN
jgi:hypothetical protein